MMIWLVGWTQDPVFRWTSKHSTTACTKDAQAAGVWMGAARIHRFIQGSSSVLYLFVSSPAMHLVHAGSISQSAVSKMLQNLLLKCCVVLDQSTSRHFKKCFSWSIDQLLAWYSTVVYPSGCPSVCQWHCTLWLNNTSYCKSVWSSE